ncbi:MAG: epoxide hydrolase family protein [Acidobacteriota bacterium]
MPAERFRIEVPEPVLKDLRERIARTRWPDEIPGAGWRYGASTAYLTELLAYWRDGFDWRARERSLNELSHFRADIGGLRVHFVHERGEGPAPMPLIVTHGWPSSFFEMTKLIPLLTRPSEHGGRAEDAFDVVVPSLPGTGFSDIPSTPGMTKTRIAGLWAALMTDVLGYPRFGARGGDIGSGVTAWLAVDHPDRVAGIHVSDVLRPALGPGSAPLSPAERRFLDEEIAWMEREGAYDRIQATKPQTLAHGLTDSPAGLAAWLVEKFRSWSDCGGEIERRFSRDDLLTHLTIYWVTGTINAANRLYFDRDQAPRALAPGQRVEVPCAVSLFPADIDHPPREWAERACRVERWTEMPRGGHFAAWEEPQLLAEDLREFFRPLREAGDGVGKREPSDQRERDGRGTTRSTRSGIGIERQT